MNKTRYKSLNKIAADPRVKEIWSEQGTGDGIWILLADGWQLDDCCVVHEWTVKDLIRSFRRITNEPRSISE
jgi:hypothetical protein